MITCTACNHANPGDSAFCTECGKPLAVKDDVGTLNTPSPEDYRKPADRGESPDLAPGSIFADRYTIVEKIGQGGMGAVYRATEKLGTINRDLALKLIRADRLADQAAIDRLMNEGALTQGIRHDNVVAVYNVGVAQNTPFVAMEFLEGISLRAWLRRQRYADVKMDPPPMALVASIVRSILDGLGAAHAKGVIHRDMKPENVMLMGEPTAESAPLKILDFGIASAPGTGDVLTGTGLGTPDYMASEQRTDPARANAASDLYSLSKMLYEMLMGSLPTAQMQGPSGGRSDVPQAIDDLIKQGMSDAQRLRPQSAQEYREALDKALGSQRTQRDTRSNLFEGKVKPPVAPGKLLNTPMKIGLGVAGSVMVLAGLANLGDDTSSSDKDNDIPAENADQLRDPQFTDYSGIWLGDAGTTLDLTVDGGGNVSGNGSSNGYSFGVGGAFQNSALVYTSPDGQSFTIPMQMPGNWCHVALTEINPSNGQPFVENFHVNHQPQQECPALYSE